MATVKGPLFSLSASGTYAAALCFRSSSKNTTVSPPPTAPKERSSAQQDQNARTAEMAAYWSALDAPTKASWAACGSTVEKTGYQLFWQEWFAQNSSPTTPPLNPCG